MIQQNYDTSLTLHKQISLLVILAPIWFFSIVLEWIFSTAQTFADFLNCIYEVSLFHDVWGFASTDTVQRDQLLFS